ncbi:hypothetical protein ACIA8R_50025 [Nonomuraea sp. NPDC051191]|uniref:hypothetical protein n=1 Tax=Nonomuraea sp. NPDC051191 TaxID=3364372 RepID=UPI0037943885
MTSGRKGRPAGLLPPALLAVLIALGLAAMHTLGHVGGQNQPLPVSAGAVQAHDGPSSMPDHGGAPGGGHDTAPICLAIAAGLIALALPLLHVAGLLTPPSGGLARLGWRIARRLRGPPDALVLRRTVVLRT